MLELVLENGSGLSRTERISAGSLGQLLLAAFRSAAMPELMASLPGPRRGRHDEEGALPAQSSQDRRTSRPAR